VTNKTVFHDMRQGALAVYRVTTESSVYIVGFHEDRGRRFVVVRGLPGTDREHVVIRDSDPRIGEHSMHDLMPHEWVGKPMEIATMTSSLVTAVTVESDRGMIASVGGNDPSAKSPWSRPKQELPPPPAWSPVPPGMPERPRIAVGFGARGTSVVDQALAQSQGIGHKVVVGTPGPAPAEPELPYPKRHVRYAEDAAALLRSIARRDRLFEDLANDKELRDRLRKSLDDCAELLETIRRRDRR
jgi:hypothetical protein